jgi:hypothetical protein
MRINVWVVLIVLIALPMTRAPRCVCGELRTPCIRARRTGSRFKNPTASGGEARGGGGLGQMTRTAPA